MKAGDALPLSIQGIQVGQAVVEAVESDRVTVVFAAQRVVIATRTQLTEDKPERDTSGTEHVITGVDRVETKTPEVTPEAPAAAPVVTPEAPAAPVENKDTVVSTPENVPEGTAANPGA